MEHVVTNLIFEDLTNLKRAISFFFAGALIAGAANQQIDRSRSCVMRLRGRSTRRREPLPWSMDDRGFSVVPPAL